MSGAEKERERKKLGSLADQFAALGKTHAHPQTDTQTSAQPLTEMMPETEMETEAEPFTQTYPHNRRGRQAFEKTHKRATYWVLKPLIVRLQKVSRRHEISQTELIEEGIRYVLKKYEGVG